MKVRLLSPADLYEQDQGEPEGAKNDSATEAIRYSGAISDRITRQSSSRWGSCSQRDADDLLKRPSVNIQVTWR
jgi:hypothetical protein